MKGSEKAPQNRARVGEIGVGMANVHCVEDNTYKMAPSFDYTPQESYGQRLMLID